jgi:hypothetical protein
MSVDYSDRGPHNFGRYDLLRSLEGDEAIVWDVGALYVQAELVRSLPVDQALLEIEQFDSRWFRIGSIGAYCDACGAMVDVLEDDGYCLACSTLWFDEVCRACGHDLGWNDDHDKPPYCSDCRAHALVPLSQTPQAMIARTFTHLHIQEALYG